MVEKVTPPASARLRDVIGRVDDATMQAVEQVLLLVVGIRVP
jgi:mRNA-degrading endonuclease toxin of MazEF toxin-antitoxin module